MIPQKQQRLLQQPQLKEFKRKINKNKWNPIIEEWDPFAIWIVRIHLNKFHLIFLEIIQKNGETTLYKAACKDFKQIVKILVEHESNVHLQDTVLILFSHLAKALHPNIKSRPNLSWPFSPFFLDTFFRFVFLSLLVWPNYFCFSFLSFFLVLFLRGEKEMALKQTEDKKQKWEQVCEAAGIDFPLSDPGSFSLWHWTRDLSLSLSFDELLIFKGLHTHSKMVNKKHWESGFQVDLSTSSFFPHFKKIRFSFLYFLSILPFFLSSSLSISEQRKCFWKENILTGRCLFLVIWIIK